LASSARRRQGIASRHLPRPLLVMPPIQGQPTETTPAHVAAL